LGNDTTFSPSGAGGAKPVEVVRFRITAAGRRALDE
jgi:hypothetical protein